MDIANEMVLFLFGPKVLPQRIRKLVLVEYSKTNILAEDKLLR
jgi:hypothetical protein